MTELQSARRVRVSTRHYWLETGPLWAYAGSFIGVVSIYSLGWSQLYSPLSGDVIGFIVGSIAICVLIASVERASWRPTVHVVRSWWTTKRVFGVSVSMYLLLYLECLHAGGIPLVMLFRGDEYDYSKFGVPTLHVVLFGIYSILTVHWFNLWLNKRPTFYLINSIALLFLNVLIVNRGALLQTLLAMGLLYATHRRLTIVALLIVGCVLLLLTVIFGVIGDLRMIAGGIDPAATILIIGDATPSYPIEALGTGPFWLYLYATSPLANWQLNVLQYAGLHADMQTFVALELLPDFIGKHLVDQAQFSLTPMLVTDALTVSSAYGRAFYLAGWSGCVFVFLLFLGYYFIVRKAFRGTEYFGSAIGTLAAGAALLTFFNMLTFSGLIAPLCMAGLMRLVLRNGRNPQRQLRERKEGAEVRR